MDSKGNESLQSEVTRIFDRVVSILEQARNNVVWSVNYNMVMTHWLIGQVIVEEIQAGEERAEYGKKILDQLSTRLNQEFMHFELSKGQK